jgi:hypothetical protein
MGNSSSTNDIRVRIWHKFSKNIPRGWPQNGCLYFTVNQGTTIKGLLEEINRHRRPEYIIKSLHSITGYMYNESDIIRTSDFYV